MKKNKSAKEIFINNFIIENLENNKKNKKDNNNLFATQIYILRKNNTDKKVEELISTVEKYKKDIQEKILYGKEIPHYKFRKTICRNIELNLVQLGEMKNKEKRDECINKLYKWYKNKVNFFYTLSRMNKRSYIKKDEQYDNNLLNQINNEKEKLKKNEIDSDEERKHRTKITYKKIHYYIDEFKKHQIRDKKSGNNDNKSVEIRRPMFKNNKIKHFKYTNHNLYKFYTKKIKEKNSEPTVFDTAIPKYETKSSYSIERPEYNSISLKIEKKINSLKNKHLAEKRNKEQIQKYMDDFGKTRAMFKSDLNKNSEIKNIIKEFKTFEKNRITKSKNSSMIIEEKNKNDILQKDIVDVDNNKKDSDNIIIAYNEDKGNRKRNTRRINKINLNNVKNMDNNSLLITTLYKIDKKNEENEEYENTNYFLKRLFITNKEDNNKNNNMDNYKDNEDNNEENNKEKTININFEFPKLKSNRLLSFKKNENDSVIKNITIDPVYKTKRYASKLCSLNNNRNLDYKQSFYSLSNTKYMSCSCNNIYDKYDKSIINNRHNYTKKTMSISNVNDYLKIKNRFNIFKNEEYSKLKTFINEKEHYDTLNKTALFNAFIDPKFDTIYPNYYLPRNNGYNLLLSRQRPINEKRKKK